MSKQYARLTDSQWAKVKPYLNTDRARKYDLRDIVDAILWLARTGAQWRNLDSQFPPHKSVFYYFSKWSRKGTLEGINEELNRLERQKVHGREACPSLVLIDAQSVRLDPRIGANRGIDGGKWVNGRKRTILTDTLGRVWRVSVAAGNVHDGVAGLEVLEPNLTGQMERVTKVLADSAYRGQFADALAEVDPGVAFEVPERPEGVKGFVIEKQRWVVERSFAWLAFFRRVTRDHERTIQNAATWVLVANMQMVLSSLERNGI